ncbi:hypothetical protein FNV43_RR06050 [Rhamnella rubrinervis]|uniref:Uncharacterized protein n=1 Tax=Rhamnella rubrinervis TaxID=2594499 RepID=A0A8K0HCB6_9ROSA|nr:hypothetical protein FNV43_RR06050 [Rhamnella rubrinervis]
MAMAHLTPLLAIPVTTEPTLFPPKNSTLTPFSAIAPPPFLNAHKLHVHISLETIYEEETEQDFVDKFQSPEAPPSATFSPTMCFLEMRRKPALSSSYMVCPRESHCA